MSRGFASNYRIVLLATGLFACFAGLGVRLVILHVVDRDELLRNVVKARRQTNRETARRGDIFDATGMRLATSRPVIKVAVDPSLVKPEDEAKLPELAKILDLPLEDVRRQFHTKYRPGKAAAVPAGASEAGQTAAGTGTMLKLNLGPLVNAGPTKAETDADLDPEFAQQMVTAGDPSQSTPPVDKPGDDDDDDTDDDPDHRGMRRVRYAPLTDHLSESAWAAVEKLNIKALCPPERGYARVYPHDTMAAHIVGFANKANQGSAGVEAFADFYLRGRDGWREGEKDGRRRELAQFQTRDVPSADGYSVVLTIDSLVQDIIEQELDKIARTYQPLKATIIVSKPQTGEILGIANYPTFNPNEYNRIPKDQLARLKNVAISDVYEPGSVFKIVAAAAALEERLVTPETSFNCGLEHITYPWHGVPRDFDLPREDHHFGQLTVAEIIAHSSNRGAAQLAMALGPDRFEAYARRFGFGGKLGFPLSGESAGIFKTNNRWNPKDFTRIPMGQSIAATALQMHQAMCTIANGGVLMRPLVIRQVKDASNKVVYDYGPDPIGRVVSPATARTVSRLLQGVASVNGTAPEAAIKIDGVDYEVAGKTGTAQKYMPELQPSGRMKVVASKKHHVVSFVGFFPASRPQVAISVIVDDADAHAPNGVAYGKSVAAPVFKTIGEKLIPILSIIPPHQAARLELAAVTEGGRR